jgi:hypothetical protein
MIKELNIEIKYLQKIPTEILVNYIIPYTYQPQRKDLLKDIISFKKDFDIIKNIYTFDYNFQILLNDLLLFWDTEKGHTFLSITHPRIKKLWGLLTIIQRTRFINKYIE